MTYEPFPAFRDWNVHFDPSVVDGYAARLEQARAKATPETQRRALEVATRYAAVDTGAIEGLYTTDRGFTKTIATQSEFWERALELKGERVRRSIDDALAGYEYVLDAVTGKVPITQNWVRELHAIITAHQETYEVYSEVAGMVNGEAPLPHGEYKHLPNSPTNASTGQVHDYAPPEATHAEMTRLMDELASTEFLAAHPVVQAAYAHYVYVCIHPFADGNGRVSRALASVFLYRNPGVPLVVFADQRDAYLDCLALADAGQPERFVEFIADRVVDTVNLVIGSLGANTNPGDVANVVAAIDRWPDDSLDLLATRLQQQCLSLLGAEATESGLPGRLDINVDASDAYSMEYSGPALPPGYRHVVPDSWVTIYARSNPNTLHQWVSVSFLIAVRPAVSDAPELLIVPTSGLPTLEVWRRELDPMLTTSLSLRLDIWAKDAFAYFIHELNGALHEGSEE